MQTRQNMSKHQTNIYTDIIIQKGDETFLWLPLLSCITYIIKNVFMALILLYNKNTNSTYI